MAAEVLGRDREPAALRQFLDRVPEGPLGACGRGELRNLTPAPDPRSYQRREGVP